MNNESECFTGISKHKKRMVKTRARSTSVLSIVFECLVQGVPKKRLPCEVKHQCCMFEFECLNSLMSPGMRKTLELGIFMLTL